MQVTFLGTGSAMPTGERFQTGLLLDADDAGPLLVDCGSGVLHGLAGSPVGYEGVSSVLLTHHHLDHVSDLDVLMKARWLAGETDLEIVGPPGTRDLVANLLDTHEYMQDRLDLTLREVEPGSFSVAGFDVEAVETIHSLYCLAYRFTVPDAPGGTETTGDTRSTDATETPDSREDTDGPAFTFSGDTEACEAVADLAEGSAVLAHDCSFPDEVDVDNHPTPSQLGEVLAGRDLGRVYLTHLYPHTDGKHEEMLESVADGYDGEVRFASDGLSFEVE